MLTYKIYPRTEKTDKKGQTPIYVRVTDNGEINRFKLPISVEMKHFDESKELDRKNSLFESIQHELNESMTEASIALKPE